MIIYLARHGQTTGDIENRYGGDYDDHLTELGMQQSDELAEQLLNKGIEKLYTSPRFRAQETAAYVGKKLELEVETMDAFRERNGYGVLTGLTKDEARSKYPSQVALLQDVHAAVEGAEEYLPFQDRIIQALKLLSLEDYKVAAVVTHGGPLRLIFRDVLKLGEIEVADCAYAVLETVGDTYHLLHTDGITMIES